MLLNTCLHVLCSFADANTSTSAGAAAAGEEEQQDETGDWRDLEVRDLPGPVSNK